MKINPVRATLKKYPLESSGIHDLNDTCYGICAAFSGVDNPLMADPACNAQCKKLIEVKKRQIYGVGSCDHEGPSMPVIWDQDRHFVPTIIKTVQDKKQIKEICMKMCTQINKNFIEDCQDLCITDVDAIDDPSPTNNKIVKEIAKKVGVKDDNENKSENWALWTVLIALIIVLGVAFVLITRKK